VLGANVAMHLENSIEESKDAWLPDKYDSAKEDGPKIATPSELVEAVKTREGRWVCMQTLVAAAQCKRVDMRLPARRKEEVDEASEDSIQQQRWSRG
jgi:hypothetical protein